MWSQKGQGVAWYSGPCTLEVIMAGSDYFKVWQLGILFRTAPLPLQSILSGTECPYLFRPMTPGNVKTSEQFLVLATRWCNITEIVLVLISWRKRANPALSSLLWISQRLLCQSQMHSFVLWGWLTERFPLQCLPVLCPRPDFVSLYVFQISVFFLVGGTYMWTDGLIMKSIYLYSPGRMFQDWSAR